MDLPSQNQWTVDKLKSIVADSSEISDRAIIVTSQERLQHYSIERSKNDQVKDILSAIGREKSEEVDVIARNIFLVTLIEHKDMLRMSSSKKINFHEEKEIVTYYNEERCLQKRVGFTHTDISYELHFIHQIKADVVGIITDIPRLISSGKFAPIKREIMNKLPFLTDVTLKYIPWNDTIVRSSNIQIKAVVHDLEAVYTKLKEGCVIGIHEHYSRLYFTSIKPIIDVGLGDIPAENVPGITIEGW